jgi:hypothetical protein
MFNGQLVNYFWNLLECFHSRKQIEERVVVDGVAAEQVADGDTEQVVEQIE